MGRPKINANATETVELTPAQAQVVIQALDSLKALIAGDIDGKRRSPWDGFAMDVDEGEEIPGALTHEAGYRLLIDTTREAMSGVWSG